MRAQLLRTGETSRMVACGTESQKVRGTRSFTDMRSIPALTAPFSQSKIRQVGKGSVFCDTHVVLAALTAEGIPDPTPAGMLPGIEVVVEPESQFKIGSGELGG
jgi:hypothetical protein